MTQLAANKKTPEAIGDLFQVTAGGTIYAGAIVAVNTSGALVPAADTANLKVVGIAQNAAKSGGVVTVKRGAFVLDQPATALTAAAIGTTVYAKDDQTIAASSTNSIAVGKVLAIIPEGVVVNVG